MRVLLDTNVLLWFLEDSPKLSQDQRIAIQEAEECFVSSMSAWEIVIKRSLGKLSLPPGFVLEDLGPFLEAQGFRWLEFHWSHALAVSTLPPLHQDPFDRALLAQAQREDLLFLTGDGKLADYGSFVSV